MTAGHKSTECYNRSGHQSAAQPAVTQSWGADYAGYDWQPSGPSAEQVFSALEWHQDRQPEAHQKYAGDLVLEVSARATEPPGMIREAARAEVGSREAGANDKTFV